MVKARLGSISSLQSATGYLPDDVWENGIQGNRAKQNKSHVFGRYANFASRERSKTLSTQRTIADE
jgi:hypothetical protein